MRASISLCTIDDKKCFPVVFLVCVCSCSRSTDKFLKLKFWNSNSFKFHAFNPLLDFQMIGKQLRQWRRRHRHRWRKKKQIDKTKTRKKSLKHILFVGRKIKYYYRKPKVSECTCSKRRANGNINVVRGGNKREGFVYNVTNTHTHKKEI